MTSPCFFGVFNTGIKIKRPKPLLRAFCVFVVLLFTSTLRSLAQDYIFPQETKYSLRLGADQEFPGSGLKDNYRTAINYNAGFMRTFEKFTFEAVVSYRKFGAYGGVRTDTSDPANVATTIISPYTTYLFYISGTYNLMQTGKMTIYGGLNLGSCISKSAVSYFDNTTNLYLPYTYKQAYMAPKLGFTYLLSDSWGIDARVSYNIFNGGGGVSYYSHTGAGVSSAISTISAGVGLMYKF